MTTDHSIMQDGSAPQGAPRQAGVQEDAQVPLANAANQVPPGRRAANPSRSKPIQFNWRRHWSKKVEPLLDEELVQDAIDFGMSGIDPDWQTGDPPWLLGRPDMDSRRIMTGKLSWYQPLGCCHDIAFFSMAIGVLNYPDLDWRFAIGDLHTVPVGYGPDGEPRVVMDILLFEHYDDAAASIASTLRVAERWRMSAEVRQNWDYFEDDEVPLLKKRAQELRSKRRKKRH